MEKLGFLVFYVNGIAGDNLASSTTSLKMKISEQLENQSQERGILMNSWLILWFHSSNFKLSQRVFDQSAQHSSLTSFKVGILFL